MSEQQAVCPVCGTLQIGAPDQTATCPNCDRATVPSEPPVEPAAPVVMRARRVDANEEAPPPQRASGPPPRARRATNSAPIGRRIAREEPPKRKVSKTSMTLIVGGIIVVLIVVSVAGIALVNALNSSGRNPTVYRPSPTPENSAALLKSPYPGERIEGAGQLGRIGAPAHTEIAQLILLLDDPNPQVASAATDAVIAIGRKKLCALVEFKTEWAEACREIKPAIERLKAEGLPIVICDTDRHPELVAVFNIEKIPTLLTIRDDQEIDRNVGVLAEADIRVELQKVRSTDTVELRGTTAQARTYALLLALIGDDAWLAFLAAEELTADAGAANRFQEILSGKYPGRLRAAAIKAFSNSIRGKTPPPDVVASLKRVCGSETESLEARGSACLALREWKIDEPSSGAVLKLALEKSSRADLLEAAADAMGERRVFSTIPRLIELLKHPAPGVRRAAAGALGAMASRTGNALPALIAAFEAEAPGPNREAYRQALEQITDASPDTTAALVKELKNPNEDVRSLMLKLLNSLDLPPSAIVIFHELLDDIGADVRMRAAIALQKRVPEDPKILRILMDTLENDETQYEAGEALRNSGEQGHKLLLQRLLDPGATAQLRLRISRLLGGPRSDTAKTTRATLTAALDSKDLNVAKYAALALCWITPEDPALVKPLAHGLASKDPEIAQACARALGMTKSRAAVPPLLDAIRRFKDVRQAAGLALSGLERDEKTVMALVELLIAPETRTAATSALTRLKHHREIAAPGLIDAFASAEKAERYGPGAALVALGEPAVGPLMALFEKRGEPEELRLAALGLLARMGSETREIAPRFEKYLKGETFHVRVRAAMILLRHNPKAGGVGLLMDALERKVDEDDDENDGNPPPYEIYTALGRLGSNGAAAIDRALIWLNGPDETLRIRAIQVLRSVGADSPEVIAAMISQLKVKQEPKLRVQMRYSFRGFDSKSAVPELIKALADPSYSRADVIGVLQSFGPKATDAIPHLIPLLDHADRALALGAAIAIANIDPKAEAVPVLLEGIRGDGDQRLQALYALDRYKTLDRSAVPDLIRALDSPQTRYLVLNSLSHAGPNAEAAVETLAGMLRSRDRDMVARVLGDIGPAAAPAVPHLLRMLGRESNSDPAATALGKIGGEESKRIVARMAARLARGDGPVTACRMIGALGRLDPEVALPALRKAMRDADPELRVAAISALGQWKNATMADDLIAAMKDPEASVRSAAADALGQLGAEGKSGVPSLSVALKAKEVEVRSSAARALGEIGAPAAAAVPALIEALGHADSQYTVAYAIGQIGIAAKGVVPSLVEALDRPALRRGAIAALGNLKTDAKSAIPKLNELTKDHDSEVSSAAELAIARIEGKELPYDDDDRD